MTLTTKDVLSLLDGKQMTQGRALGHLRRGSRPGHSLPRAQLDFVKAVYESYQRKPKGEAVPAHPEKTSIRHRYRRESDGELTPVELAWLDRLPRDPAKVRFEDAERLAALAGSISEMRSPQSARLVNSIWEPVKALHDHRVAAADLERAKRPLPAVPEQVTDALIDALSVDHPGVPRAALHVQANEMLAKVRDERQQRHADGLRHAQRRADELAQQQAGYDDLTRDVEAGS